MWSENSSRPPRLPLFCPLLRYLIDPLAPPPPAASLSLPILLAGVNSSSLHPSLSLSCLHASASPPVICPCPSPPPTATTSSPCLCDPSLPSCQSLLFLAAQWPGQAGVPGLEAAHVMTGNTGPHTLSGNTWRSALSYLSTASPRTSTHTRAHTERHDSLCMDNCQTAPAVTLDSAQVSDEAQCRRNTPFPALFLCAFQTMSFFFLKVLHDVLLFQPWQPVGRLQLLMFSTEKEDLTG